MKSLSAVSSVASPHLQQPSSEHSSSSRFGKVAKGCKGLACHSSTGESVEEEGLLIKQSLGQVNSSFTSTLCGSSQTTWPAGVEGAVTMPLDTSFEKKGRKRISRKSRRILEATGLNGGAGIISCGSCLTHFWPDHLPCSSRQEICGTVACFFVV